MANTICSASPEALYAEFTAGLARMERAAMAYERLGKLTRDDEKTRQIRKDAIADLAAARIGLCVSFGRALIDGRPTEDGVLYAQKDTP